MSCLIIGSPWDNLELLWGETQQKQSIPQYITIRMPDNAFIFHVLTFQWPVRKRGRLGRLLVGFTAWITLWYREGVTSNNAWQNDIAQLIGKHWVFHKHPGLKNAAFKNQLYLLTWCSNVHPMTDCNGSRPSIRIGSHDTTTNPHTSLEDLEPSASCSVHFEIPCTIPNLRDLVKANDLNSCQRLNQSHLLEFVSHSRFGYIRKGRKQKWIQWHVRSDLLCLASWKVACDATLLISPRPAEELWAWRCSPTFTVFRCRFFGSFGMPLISSDTHPAIISNGGVSQLQSSCPILSRTLQNLAISIAIHLYPLRLAPSLAFEIHQLLGEGGSQLGLKTSSGLRVPTWCNCGKDSVKLRRCKLQIQKRMPVCMPPCHHLSTLFPELYGVWIQVYQPLQEHCFPQDLMMQFLGPRSLHGGF